MANLLKMADMQAILALHGLGWSNRRIARELDIHRETVGDYVRAGRFKTGQHADRLFIPD